MRKPNLFILGAMKSGTTSLHGLLGQHTDIFMCEPKEPCYFIEPELLRKYWPEMWHMGFWRSEAEYLKLFNEAGDVPYLGESSTDYTKMPRFSGVAQKICRFSGHKTRFIYIMRDPIERTISHYWHMVEHRGERRPPLQAFREDPHYIEVSYYAYQLKPYYEIFGQEHVYTLTFESLMNETLSTLQGICRWLGIEPFQTLPEDMEARNVTPNIIENMRLQSVIRPILDSVIVSSLASKMPSGIKHAVKNLFRRRIVRQSFDLSQAIDYLRSIHAEQTRELILMTGKKYDEWKTLNES